MKFGKLFEGKVWPEVSERIGVMSVDSLDRLWIPVAEEGGYLIAKSRDGQAALLGRMGMRYDGKFCIEVMVRATIENGRLSVPEFWHVDHRNDFAGEQQHAKFIDETPCTGRGFFEPTLHLRDVTERVAIPFRHPFRITEVGCARDAVVVLLVRVRHVCGNLGYLRLRQRRVAIGGVVLQQFLFQQVRVQTALSRENPSNATDSLRLPMIADFDLADFRLRVFVPCVEQSSSSSHAGAREMGSTGSSKK